MLSAVLYNFRHSVLLLMKLSLTCMQDASKGVMSVYILNIVMIA